jgi:wyosine [tRNA(Phe)-imidazoG37] synthetase (radical SAM superfamily)
VYYQLGKTLKMTAERGSFYKPDEIYNDVKLKIEQSTKNCEFIDYLTFVSDGEPTLDSNLCKEIALLKSYGKKIAVISNASLIWREDVKLDLHKADWVSLKVDAIRENTWHKIDRPHRLLNISKMKDGMLSFRNSYTGILTTESMLVQGLNDDVEEITAIADFLAVLNPEISYLAIPSRPPAVKTVIAASEQTINMAYQVFKQRLDKVELLLGYEGNSFSYSGNIEDDLLNITAVHPMREDAVKELLKKADTEWELVDRLIRDCKLLKVEYLGMIYYIRNWK